MLRIGIPEVSNSEEARQTGETMRPSNDVVNRTLFTISIVSTGLFTAAYVFVFINQNGNSPDGVSAPYTDDYSPLFRSVGNLEFYRFETVPRPERRRNKADFYFESAATRLDKRETLRLPRFL